MNKQLIIGALALLLLAGVVLALIGARLASPPELVADKLPPVPEIKEAEPDEPDLEVTIVVEEEFNLPPLERPTPEKAAAPPPEAAPTPPPAPEPLATPPVPPAAPPPAPEPPAPPPPTPLPPTPPPPPPSAPLPVTQTVAVSNATMAAGQALADSMGKELPALGCFFSEAMTVRQLAQALAGRGGLVIIREINTDRFFRLLGRDGFQAISIPEIHAYNQKAQLLDANANGVQAELAAWRQHLGGAQQGELILVFNQRQELGILGALATAVPTMTQVSRFEGRFDQHAGGLRLIIETAILKGGGQQPLSVAISL